MPESGKWVLIAHGGAKDIGEDEEDSNRAGILVAVNIGTRILAQGGSALDAVEAVVKSLELNPTYNAGLLGSVRNEEGEIEMDASIMDGCTLEIGAVAGIQNIEHPVSVARALLKEKPVLLVGAGAGRFAEQKGFAISPDPPPREKKASGCDTVGCVARDQSGGYAVATSTGGLKGARAGRVGDVPFPGCGFYADNKRGAVSASGEGEAIARVLLASHYLGLLAEYDADEAAAQALKELDRVKGEAGLIAIGPDGAIGWAHTSANFAVGMARDDGNPPGIYLRKSEEK